jgi:hypothetical protein
MTIKQDDKLNIAIEGIRSFLYAKGCDGFVVYLDKLISEHAQMKKETKMYDHEDNRTTEERYNDTCNKADDDRNAAHSSVTMHPYAGDNPRPFTFDTSSANQHRMDSLQYARQDPMGRTRKGNSLPEGDNSVIAGQSEDVRRTLCKWLLAENTEMRKEFTNIEDLVKDYLLTTTEIKNNESN